MVTMVDFKGTHYPKSVVLFPKFDSKSGNFAIFNFLLPFFSMTYCPQACCFGETAL